MIKRSKKTVRYFFVSFTMAFFANQLVFQGSRLLEKGRFHYDLALHADTVIPFLPWTIILYFGCFLFWVYAYWIVSRLPRQTADRFFCANLLGKGICFFIFVLFPTTLSRPDVTGTSIWDSAVRFLYRIDAPDNLFPSLHCMISWLCWVGIRGDRQVPFPLRAAALLMAFAVCLSTLTIRQHVMLDAVGGVLLSEICYLCAGSEKLLRGYSSFIDRILTGTKQQKEKLMI